MKIVIVDKKETELQIKEQSLFVNTQRIPLHLMEMLVLAQNTALSSKLLMRLSNKGIATLMIDKTNSNFALTLPLESKNSEQKMAQYESLEHRLGFAKYFVNHKIATHCKQLQRLGVEVKESEWQHKINVAEQVADILGYEGSFSRFYFQHYFANVPKVFHKGKRSKRPPNDPLNAMLSYLYTIAYNVITAKLHQSGLDPSISYLHTPFRSHYALSSDFLELFRADINALAAEWFLDETLKLEDFKKKKGVYLHYESRKRLWPQVDALMKTVAKQTVKEIALLKAAIL